MNLCFCTPEADIFATQRTKRLNKEMKIALMFRWINICVYVLALWLGNVEGFTTTTVKSVHRSDVSFILKSSRRSFVDTASALLVSTLILKTIEPSYASGGATAGGVYLLSAKQRYNTRVTKGVVTFLAIGSQLEKNDIDSIRNFFASEEVGSWKDFSASGYLLANAFRTSSSKSPDSLPSVQKWKAYVVEVENITKALKKKDITGASSAFQKAVGALDAYLEKVELPSSKEVTVV